MGEEPPPITDEKCFDHQGLLCNRKDVGEPADEEIHRNRRQRHLEREVQAGVLWDGIKKANAEAAQERKNLERKAQAFEAARADFEGTFRTYQKQAMAWRDVIQGLEDDYTLHCRPFHDVSMR